MINYSQCTIKQVVSHIVGSHSENEGIKYGSNYVQIDNHGLHSGLLTYFISHFKEPEYFQFTYANDEIELNPLFNYIGNLFDDPESMLIDSKKIADLLYQKSAHPQIKSGEVYIVYFRDIILKDYKTDAIGIFKAEQKDSILQLKEEKSHYLLSIETGTNIQKIDKGCIIFDIDRENGFLMVNIDQSNRFKEAAYWREEFLQIRPYQDDYQQTRQYIQITKQFVKNRMSKEFDLDKTEESATMHQAQLYFKNNESFNDIEYEEALFKDKKVVEAFRDFKEEFSSNFQTELKSQFEISDYAVKKSSRIFKSIIKLDKNFHIYIHGDRRKIDKGVDEEGKKYYILYYEDEN